jgi:predicted 2-oxoglutarate/Fe(II)-dependent dioxygenase YbiX
MLVVDNFLSISDCNKIISIGNQKWEPSLSGNGEILERFRKSKQISPNVHKGEWLYDLIKTSFLKHNIEITTDVLKEVQIIKYEVGDYIVKHTDVMGYATNSDRIDRYYVLNIILNDDFKGGDFIHYDLNDNPTILEKKSGIGLIFRTNIFHEVKPITMGTRYSLSVFIHPTDFKMKTNLF